MFEWLFLLLAPVLTNVSTPPQKDYVSVVAAEAAYAALLPRTAVAPVLVDTKDCTVCKGTGRVPTGDGLSWTKCQNCKTGSVGTGPKRSSMQLQVNPLPDVSSDK